MEKIGMGKKVFVLFIIIGYIFILYVVLDANKYQATVHIIEGTGKVGVNPTSESLDFGDISLGMSAKRRVTLTNGIFVPIRVLIWKTGSIKNLLKVSDQNFRLEPKSNVKIEFTTYIPASATIDQTYDGRVYIFKIPTFGL